MGMPPRSDNESGAAQLLQLGDALLSAGRAGEARAVLERALLLRPQAAAIWVRLGDAHVAQGRDDRAIEAYDRAIECNAALLRAWQSRREAAARIADASSGDGADAMNGASA